MAPKTRAPRRSTGAARQSVIWQGDDAEYHEPALARNITRVEITVDGYGERGALCNVRLAGELIVLRSVDPEHDAARVLMARGISGPFETIGADGRTRMRFASIEAAASVTMTEKDRDGLQLRRWLTPATTQSDPPSRFPVVAGGGVAGEASGAMARRTA
jgi:hypothetical protein